MSRERIDITSEARDPNAFKKQKFWLSQCEDQKDVVLMNWSDNPGNAVEVPEYVFREMAEQYLDKFYKEYIQYKGLRSLSELTTPDASFFFQKYVPNESERLERFRSMGYGRKNDKA
jgi:hypothetical protein